MDALIPFDEIDWEKVGKQIDEPCITEEDGITDDDVAVWMRIASHPGCDRQMRMVLMAMAGVNRADKEVEERRKRYCGDSSFGFLVDEAVAVKTELHNICEMLRRIYFNQQL